MRNFPVHSWNLCPIPSKQTLLVYTWKIGWDCSITTQAHSMYYEFVFHRSTKRFYHILENNALSVRVWSIPQMGTFKVGIWYCVHLTNSDFIKTLYYVFLFFFFCWGCFFFLFWKCVKISENLCILHKVTLN